MPNIEVMALFTLDLGPTILGKEADLGLTLLYSSNLESGWYFLHLHFPECFNVSTVNAYQLMWQLGSGTGKP